MMNNIALKRWLVLGGLLILTLYLAWNSPQPETQATRVPARDSAAFTATDQTRAPMSRDFRLAPRAQAVDDVVDLFAPAVVKRLQVEQPVVSQAAPARVVPQAPPLPFTFVGKITEADGVKIFLQADNVLYSVKIGDIFAQQYQLAGVENGKLSLLYLPLNITQTMFYGEAP